jgi:hypothetical protein
VKKKTLLPASFLALLMVVLTFGMALAHTGIKAGNYEIEVGWQDEPAVVGQRNAIVVNLADSTADDKLVDTSKLVVNIVYGGQNKTLTLQPLSEDSKNQYIAPIIPAVPGEYTVQLRGKIGDTEVNADVPVEEVAPVDSLAFPSVPAAPQAQPAMRLGDWLAIGALVVALAALVLAIRKSRS